MTKEDIKELEDLIETAIKQFESGRGMFGLATLKGTLEYF